jgi:oligoendopeptidase F
MMVIILTLGLCVTCGQAQMKERAQVADQDKWRLEDIYESDQSFKQAKEKVTNQFEQILKYKGKLAGSASDLLACLELNSNISKQLARLSSYASMKSDEDTRRSKYVAMKQQIEQIATNYRAKSAFIEPEIAAMERSVIDGFLAVEPGLKTYRMYLDNIQRVKGHILSAGEEKILAEAGMLASGPSSIYGIFSNADFPYPEITLSDRVKVLLTKAGFAKYRAVTNRRDRQAVFEAFFKAIDKFRATFGAQLDSQVRKDMFYSRARNYESSLHAALDGDNIPVRVYTALIENVNKNLDTFHRYLRLKRRMLGVDTLEYSDMYAPVVEGVDLQYTVEQSKSLVLDAVRPLGDDYCSVVRGAFESRWIDLYPTAGKRAGAYCNGDAYDVHPYMLLNYNGQYDDVSTLAHELGHAMHSYYSNKCQPYATADYATFVAEVASTLNEALLIDKMLKEIEDDSVRLSLLMNYLDGAKSTLFRQTQFAEFELRIHQAAESGEALTGDLLSNIYGEILKKYYGHDKGVCQIDDLYAIEWAYVPHFYYNFYVYQYATSFTASTALSEKVLAGEPGAVAKYIEFLSSGGSDYPIELLKKAGVDMTAAEPFEKTMAAMNRVMDQIETILKRRAG